MSVPLPTTPSQTAGPFLSLGMSWDAESADVVPEGTPGAILVYGTVYDGAGELVTDALVETWQADPDGRFDHPDDPRGARQGSHGFGRCLTDARGAYAIRTLRPGALPGIDGVDQAPHIDVSMFTRGLLHRVVTRIYFADDAAMHAADPVLAGVPAERRHTLVAEREAGGYRFDIRLQGEEETVFFDV